MDSKPVVAMAVPEGLMPAMFLPEDLARLRDLAEVTPSVARPDAQNLAPHLARAVAAITCWGSPRFDAALLDLAPRLKLVAHSAGSVKGVVSDALYDRGVKVTTAAAANAGPVAEFTVAMMISLLKQVPWLAGMYSRGEKIKSGWPISDVDARPVRELRDMSIGLLGASRVGREVIRLLQSYPRLKVMVYDPYLTAEQAASLGVEKVTLEQACACEVVSVHAPSIAQTRHMLDARTLSLLPDHAVLINTARGSLIDEAALVSEVRRRPLYVLLDVTDPEPPGADSPLRTETNIILTPHIAGAVAQARRDMGRIAIHETIRILQGQPLQHEVTREMLPTQA
jgi:phosphoglycerate dehydrogenase-like enzyme